MSARKKKATPAKSGRSKKTGARKKRPARKRASRTPVEHKAVQHGPRVVELAAKGWTWEEIAQDIDTSIPSLHRWRKECDAFDDACKLANDRMAAFWARTGRANIGNRNFNTQLYSFLTSNIIGWSSKNSHEHGAKAGAGTTVVGIAFIHPDAPVHESEIREDEEGGPL